MISGIIGLLGAFIGLMLFVFWIVMLLHAVTNKRIGGVEKVAWTLVVLCLNLLGAIIYFFVGRANTSS